MPKRSNAFTRKLAHAENPDELHDALLWLGFLTEAEAQPEWRQWLGKLTRKARSVAQYPEGNALDCRGTPAAVHSDISEGGS